MQKSQDRIRQTGRPIVRGGGDFLSFVLKVLPLFLVFRKQQKHSGETWGNWRTKRSLTRPSWKNTHQPSGSSNHGQNISPLGRKNMTFEMFFSLFTGINVSSSQFKEEKDFKTKTFQENQEIKIVNSLIICSYKSNTNH